MKIPDVSCKINAYCEINPSEDPKKVEQAIINILGDVDVKINNESINASSSNIESLKKIYDSIQSHRSKNAYRRQLKQNLNLDYSWFYLNKQAAYANQAMLWRIWQYYWTLSRQGELCPEVCKDDERFYSAQNRAIKFVCQNLKAIGLSDQAYCTSEGIGNLLNLINFKSVRGTIPNN